VNPRAPFHGVDWPAELNSPDLDVRLVVPLIVVHELDRLKRQGNSTTAKSAHAAVRWLLDVLPHDPSQRSQPLPGSTQRRTTIEIYVHDGPTRPPDTDAVVIDFARRLRAVSEMPTVLVTRDLNMRVRAAAQSVDVRQLADPPPA
jgi:predicted ribonuclease YlaK